MMGFNEKNNNKHMKNQHERDSVYILGRNIDSEIQLFELIIKLIKT